MKDHWDKIGASVPVNSQAAKSIGRGFEYTSPKKVLTQEWDSPPTMFSRIPKGEFDLTGHKFGRFTVIGKLMWEKRSVDKALWVCRCACGKYAARTSKAARNPANAEIDRCEQCRHVAYLKREDSADRRLQRKRLER